MANCDFDWSMCTTCASAGGNLCPLENNRTIRKLKARIDELESKIEETEDFIRRGGE